MYKCDFFDVEYLDGYMSGVIYIYDDDKRYILDFGYDVEFSSLKLMNCRNKLYDDGNSYTYEEIANIHSLNYGIIVNDIKAYLKYNHGI